MKSTYLSKLLIATAASGFVGILYASQLTGIMRESPKLAREHLGTNSTSVMSIDNRNKFLKFGFVVIDNVLTQDEVDDTRIEINKMLDKSDLFEINENGNLSVRKDKVYWISEPVAGQKSILGEKLLHALRQVRAVPQELSDMVGFEEIDLGVPFSNQLACYDGDNAHYVAHRDTPEVNEGEFQHPLSFLLTPGMQERKLTVILYLNEATWDSNAGGLEDSGNLKCFMNADLTDITGETASKIVKIEPIGGRMVIFDSKKILHEVCPTATRRVALTCWSGGNHSQHEWMRLLFVPPTDIDFKYVLSRITNNHK